MVAWDRLKAFGFWLGNFEGKKMGPQALLAKKLCGAGALACSFKEQPGAAGLHFSILGGGS
jgi:hypothetical protein